MTEDREPPGIMIAYWDQKELEADGLPMPTHINEDQTKGKGTCENLRYGCRDLCCDRCMERSI